jgi:uncharacterized phage infection (PIP) family protein YhgE
VDQLERVRLEVIAEARTREVEEFARDFTSWLETYFRQISKESLLTPQTQTDFVAAVDNFDVEPDIARDGLRQIDLNLFVDLMRQQQPELMTPEEAGEVLNHLGQGRDRAITVLEDRINHQLSQVRALQARVESYLWNTHRDELNPEGIKRDLRTLLEDPEVGLTALRTRFSHFDRDTLVRLLSQRQDVDETQVNQILDQMSSIWDSTIHAPQNLTGKVKEQYDRFSDRLSNYLSTSQLQNLDSEGLRRDLEQLINDPQAGFATLRRRLSHVDRENLVRLLSQRQDLSEEQINQIIDQVQTTLRQITRAPRRLATRTQQRVLSFENSLEEYLRNTHKEELNPDGIKRDLQLLLHDPRLGLSSIGDRLSHFDRSTLVALLAQRPDMTEAEANRVVD